MEIVDLSARRREIAETAERETAEREAAERTEAAAEKRRAATAKARATRAAREAKESADWKSQPQRMKDLFYLNLGLRAAEERLAKLAADTVEEHARIAYIRTLIADRDRENG